MKRIIFITFATISLISLKAQTLEECRNLAKEHYPEIKQYDLISRTEQYNISNAAKAWIPQVVISGQATYQSATPTYPEVLNNMIASNGLDMSGIRKDQYKIAIDISQNIWDGGKSKANKAIAEAEANEQRSKTEVSLYDLQTRVDNLYFSILLLDERITITETLLQVLESNLNRMKVYYNNGVALQSDVYSIEADLLSTRQTLAQIESSRTIYRRMLEVFIGQPLKDNKLIRPEMTNINNRTSARPELNLFEAQNNKINSQRKGISASLMPQFSAFAQGYYGYPGLDMFKSMVSSDWTPNAIVGIRMSWNIGALYTKKNNFNKLNIAEQQIAIEREKFLFNTQLQTMQEEGEIVRLKNAIADDNRIIELRRSVRIAAESKLENGVIDATELLRKIADETNATLNRSTHEIELLQSIYRLKTTLNQ